MAFYQKKKNELEKILSFLSQNEYTLVFFTPSKKLNFYIKNFKRFFSGRKILIAKEITKIHEAFIREEVDKLEIFETSMKGELTIIISEKNNKIINFNEKKIVNKVKKYLKNYSLKDTVKLILESEKINKKKIYDLCLRIKNEKNF